MKHYLKWISKVEDLNQIQILKKELVYKGETFSLFLL